MLRRTPVLAVLLSLAITFIGMSPTQATPPDVTAITVSKATIYPAINTANRPGTTTITAETSDPSAVEFLDVFNGGDVRVKRFVVSGSPTVEWGGLDDSALPVPAGTYTIRALNSGEEMSPTVGTVVVSRQHLIRKTLIRTIAAARYVFKYVGKCSTLRKPSKRGWAGSLGYYANTKCKTQTWNASRVITLHQTRLPAAERYVDVRVDTYGGAAKAKPRSRALVEYFQNDATLTAAKFIASKVGWHNGLTRGGAAFVDGSGWLAWRLSAAFKSQYDVKQFRVVAHYDVLSTS